MIKLIDFLVEKTIKIPQDLLSKASSAFYYIENNIEVIKKKSPKNHNQDPYIPKNFKNIFSLKNLKGDSIKVNLGLYNEPKDAAYARMDHYNNSVIVNIAKLTDEHNFITSIEHELVHAIDPKSFDPELDLKYNVDAPNPITKKSTPKEIEKYEQDLIKHLKSLAEFDAHTTTLINTISSNLAKKDKPKDLMDKAKQNLFSLLYDIKNKSYNEIYTKYENTAVPLLFLRGPWTKDRTEIAKDNFYSELIKIKAWSTNKKLYKRFLTRLGSEL